MNKSDYLNSLKIQNLIMDSHLRSILYHIEFKEKIPMRRIKETKRCLEKNNELLKENY